MKWVPPRWIRLFGAIVYRGEKGIKLHICFHHFGSTYAIVQYAILAILSQNGDSFVIKPLGPLNPAKISWSETVPFSHIGGARHKKSKSLVFYIYEIKTVIKCVHSKIIQLDWI